MLDVRQPYRPAALERAAWVGLQDSMPRAAVLSLNARVEGCGPFAWDDPTFVQVWGPRFSVYVVARRDLAVFTLGRLSDDPVAIKKAHDLADRARDAMAGEKMTLADVGRALGVHHNMLRYAAPTGTILVRWEGSGKPLVWTGPAPNVDPVDARLELARRHLHVYGPTKAAAFAKWAGIKPPRARAAYELLRDELTSVETPLGNRWILSRDVDSFRADPDAAEFVRLLPSGDSYWLFHGHDRDLLVADKERQAELWTPRVWPGAVLVGGEIAGTWRRAHHRMTVTPWRKLSRQETEAIEEEATSLPLPDLEAEVRVSWVA